MVMTQSYQLLIPAYNYGTVELTTFCNPTAAVSNAVLEILLVKHCSKFAQGVKKYVAAGERKNVAGRKIDWFRMSREILGMCLKIAQVSIRQLN